MKNSPEIDTERPVSRQHEMRYLGYYGHPCYSGRGGLWENGAYPSMLMTGDFALPPSAAQKEMEIADACAEATQNRDYDIHLRSCKGVASYRIQAADGNIGHVQDMLVDEASWAVRYLIVDTSTWCLGHQVLIAPQWIEDVSWSEAAVSVDLTRQAVKDAPPYDATVQLDREYETGLHDHYGRSSYSSFFNTSKGEQSCRHKDTDEAKGDV